MNQSSSPQDERIVWGIPLHDDLAGYHSGASRGAMQGEDIVPAIGTAVVHRDVTRVPARRNPFGITKRMVVPESPGPFVVMRHFAVGIAPQASANIIHLEDALERQLGDRVEGPFPGSELCGGILSDHLSYRRLSDDLLREGSETTFREIFSLMNVRRGSGNELRLLADGRVNCFPRVSIGDRTVCPVVVMGTGRGWSVVSFSTLLLCGLDIGQQVIWRNPSSIGH